MATKTTTLPDWLEAAITKYSLVSVASNREIFEVFLDENNSIDSPRFRKLCERLVRLKKVKKRFVTSLEAAGYFDDDVDLEADVDDTDETEEFEDDADESFEDEEDTVFEDDEEEDDDEDELVDDDEDDLEEDSDDEEELEADDDSDEEEEEAELEEEEVEEEEEEVEETTTTKRGPGRPRTKPVSQYEETGVPSLDEVTAYVGTGFNHTQEFENPLHLQIAARVLTELGFDLTYDARVEGGTIKRPRGGKFVLQIAVTEKRAVKRRGRTAPVFAYVEQILDSFDESASTLIDTLVETYTTDD
jgi:hypothetical protein